MNNLIIAGKYGGHVTELDLTHKHYYVRLFATPLGEIEPESGQPWKPYIGTLLLVVHDNVAEVQGAVDLPAYAVPALRKLGRSLNLIRLWWQRWVWDSMHSKWLKLPPAVLELT